MKNKKILKAAVMLSLATTLAVPFNTLADSQGTRIGGRDRFEVAINVANKFTNAKSCIVLNYLAYSDSISSSEIAKGDMPIYYTKSDSIDSNTLKDIRNKGYKNVFIIGGEKSVSKNVENELAKTSKVTRVSGRNRYDVNYKTLDKNKENLIVVSGENFADGLVSSALAQIKNATIAITPSNEVHERLNQYLNINKNLKNIYIVGGEKSISKNVEKELSKHANVQRISGSNRYETSEKLAREISDSKYIVVSGENFADNLVAVSLARRDKRAVVLSKRVDFSPMVRDISKNKDFVVVGGNLSIDESIFDKNLDSKTEKKTATVKETIKYNTKEEKDPTLKQGVRKTKQQGTDGEKEIIYEETYKDGVLVSKKKISENITKKPVEEIILVGTKVDKEPTVTTKRVTVKETIKYNTKEEKDPTLKQGVRKTKQQGTDGEKEIIYEETYKDGVLVSKKKISENITKKPVDKIILVGTKVDKEDEIIVKTITEYEDIDFEELKIEDRYLDNGVKEIIEKGQKGQKKITYKVEYKNGKEIKRTQEAFVIIKEPKNQVVNIGINKGRKEIPKTYEELFDYYNVGFNDPLTQKEQDIFNELNRVRKENGLNELILSKRLTRNAKVHARDAALGVDITHKWSNRFDFRKINLVVPDIGAETTWAVHWDQDARHIIEGFMNSPAHKEILMADDNVYVGIGRYDSNFDKNNDRRVEPTSWVYIKVVGDIEGDIDNWDYKSH